MKCESCNQRQATIAFTRIAGDDKQVLHLCAHCAEIIARQQKGTGEEMGEASQAGTPPAAAGGGSQPSHGSPGDEAGEASPAPPQGPGADKPPAKKVSVVVGNLSSSEKATTCPVCGMTYEEFRKVGRFGCAACYTAFAPHLQRLLKRVHGATRHLGRTPRGAAADTAAAPPQPAVPAPEGGSPAETVEQLRGELAEAVDSEAYERAAELRDRIAQLERGGDGSAAGEAEPRGGRA